MPAIESAAYLDTSVLVASLTEEVHTAATQRWLAQHSGRGLMISDWTITEFSAAFALKLRTKAISAKVRTEALAIFSSMVTRSLIVLPVESQDFRDAARLADHEKIGLRSGDALHLAIAFNQGATLYTLDRRMVPAKQLGIAVEVIA